MNESTIIPNTRTRLSLLSLLSVLGLMAGCSPSGVEPSRVEGGTGTTGDEEDASLDADATTDSGGTGGSDESDDENSLPPTPVLDSPIDGATGVPVETELCWSPVDDPDGDPIRYRVFVDGIELTEGRLGEQGHEGPCIGPLIFAHEREFSWEVQAFEVGDPERSSAVSTRWAFATEGDGIAHTVFEDGFDEELGWEIDGDAHTGAWVRGNPVAVSDDGRLSQPGSCAGGRDCYFTGQNVVGAAEDEDVSGGATRLTSPPFDLGGSTAATVQLDRFFYGSSDGPEAWMRVELLVPTDVPGIYDAHELEGLGAGSDHGTTNLWTPREYAACGVPMEDGSKLRITVNDDGDGIVEAAIDSVKIRAHDLAAICESGEGGACDPKLGADACPGDLLCCAQGTLNRGVYRCASPVPGIDADDPPATPDAPNSGPLGCDAPDLVIDESWIAPVLTDIFVSENTCEYLEGCVGGLGWRTILRFDLVAANIGSADLVLGVPANEPETFHYSECHEHHHFDGFADYELHGEEGVVARGHKQAFCLLDSYSWAWNNEPGMFDCSNQGIQRGFADIYESDLPCQWVDVTGVEAGDYTLVAGLNQPADEFAVPRLNERNYDNNTVTVPLTLE